MFLIYLARQRLLVILLSTIVAVVVVAVITALVSITHVAYTVMSFKLLVD